jgi:hypothetical protein
MLPRWPKLENQICWGKVIWNDFSCYELDVNYVAGARDTDWRLQTQTNGLGGTNCNNVTGPSETNS